MAVLIPRFSNELYKIIGIRPFGDKINSVVIGNVMSARVPKIITQNNEEIIISLNLAFKNKKEESIRNLLNAIYFKSNTVTIIFVIPIIVDCKKSLQL